MNRISKLLNDLDWELAPQYQIGCLKWAETKWPGEYETVSNALEDALTSEDDLKIKTAIDAYRAYMLRAIRKFKGTDDFIELVAFLTEIEQRSLNT